ncbi:MAG: 30S ribosomal protein S17 [Candidatus Omnitrophica bacterium]|nr:30S ribosomal protein S17 [Candidatus Omnitrophota bacterium]
MPENSNSNNNQAASAGNVKSATGVVVSDKMNKTIVVRLTSVTRHRIYRKVVRRSSKVKAHDEKNTAVTGDTVKIVLGRPLSKSKRWRLTEVVEKAKV